MTVHNALDDAFASARADGRAALIPYITGGFPDRDRFVDLALAVLDSGADMLEIGIPFSDPLLDGPSIQRSQQQVLDAGVTPQSCLECAAAIHERSHKPLLFMGAYNPIVAYGVDGFCAEAQSAGVSGLIVPDVPVEEQDELRVAANQHDLHVIQLVAPTSTDDRLRAVCRLASGFVYCISVSGVTGARADVSATARPLVESVRALTTVPVAVGFGISGPSQAREVATFADGVVVGSALIDVIASAGSDSCIPAAAGFVGSLREALGIVPST